MRQYTVPVGSLTFTRKSERTYTHLVVGTHFEGQPGYRPGTYVLGWAGRPDLAEKRASGWEAKRYNKVDVIEITPEMIREIKSRKKKEQA